MLPKQKIWKVIEGIYGAGLLAAGIHRFADLKSWGLVAGGLVFLIGLEGLVKERKLNLTAIFYVAGLLGSYAVISAGWARVFVAIAGSTLFVLQRLRGAAVKDVFLLTGSFWLLYFAWAANFYFSPPWWLMLGAAAAVMTAYLWDIVKDPAVSIAGGLMMAEVFWVLLFWPADFLTSTVAAFAVFYLFYLFYALHLAGLLNRQRVYFHATVIAIVLVLTLLSSPWQPLN